MRQRHRGKYGDAQTRAADAQLARRPAAKCDARRRKAVRPSLRNDGQPAYPRRPDYGFDGRCRARIFCVGGRVGIFRRPLPAPKLYPPPAKLVQMGQRRRAAAAYPRKSGRRSVVAAGLGRSYPKIAQRPAGAQRAFPLAFLAVYVQTLRRPRFCRVFGAVRHAHPYRQIRRGRNQRGKKTPCFERWRKSVTTRQASC